MFENWNVTRNQQRLNDADKPLESQDPCIKGLIVFRGHENFLRNKLTSYAGARPLSVQLMVKQLDSVSTHAVHMIGLTYFLQSCKAIKRAIRDENHENHDQVLRTIMSMPTADSVCLLEECEEAIELDEGRHVAGKIASFIA